MTFEDFVKTQFTKEAVWIVSLDGEIKLLDASAMHFSKAVSQSSSVVLLMRLSGPHAPAAIFCVVKSSLLKTSLLFFSFFE